MSRAKEKLEILLNYKDEKGNTFVFNEQDESLHLKIVGEHSPRKIGHILIGKDNLLYHKYEEEEHIFRKTNAWSVNNNILNLVDMVIFESKTNYYKISSVRAKEFGQWFNFTGTEKKLYVPLSYWDIRPKNITAREERLRNRIGDTWFDAIGHHFDKEYMLKLGSLINTQRKTKVVYPADVDVFKAYQFCHPNHCKVIIVGQDPYPNGLSNGLAFGYLNGESNMQSSLGLIQQEMEYDLNTFCPNFDWTLESWAKQGVLLLNSCLTVESGKPQSHKGIGWENFTRTTLWKLFVDPVPKVFILWGTFAQSLFMQVFDKVAEPKDHKILYGKHPAADLYTKKRYDELIREEGNFSGSRHFSQANEFLKSKGREPINWELNLK